MILARFRHVLLALVALVSLGTLASCEDEDEGTQGGTDAGGSPDGSSMDMSMDDMMAMDDTDGMMGTDGDLNFTTAAFTDGGSFWVAYEVADPPGVGETFSMTVSVFASDQETLLSDATLAVTPTMPSMGHGMNTEPRVTANGDGTFLVENLEYSMAGGWRLEMSVTQGDITETVAFDVVCCEG